MSSVSLLPHPQAPPGLRTIVAASDRLDALTLRRQLERLGHLPMVADHAQSALTRLALHPQGWDVVVIGLGNEPESAFELARAALGGSTGVGVVLMSAGHTAADLPVTLEAAAFLHSPYMPADLDAALAEAVASRAATPHSSR